MISDLNGCIHSMNPPPIIWGRTLFFRPPPTPPKMGEAILIPPQDVSEWGGVKNRIPPIRKIPPPFLKTKWGRNPPPYGGGNFENGGGIFEFPPHYGGGLDFFGQNRQKWRFSPKNERKSSFFTPIMGGD